MNTTTSSITSSTAVSSVRPSGHVAAAASIANARAWTPASKRTAAMNPTAMNRWLGDAARGVSFDHTCTTKRFLPGRLDGMT